MAAVLISVLYRKRSNQRYANPSKRTLQVNKNIHLILKMYVCHNWEKIQYMPNFPVFKPLKMLQLQKYLLIWKKSIELLPAALRTASAALKSQAVLSVLPEFFSPGLQNKFYVFQHKRSGPEENIALDFNVARRDQLKQHVRNTLDF